MAFTDDPNLLWVDYVLLVMHYVVLVLSTAGHHALVVVGYGFQTHPQLTAMLTTLLGLYLVYRIFRVVGLVLWALFIGVLRTVFIAAVVVACLGVYFRGSQFYTQDCHTLYRVARLTLRAAPPVTIHLLQDALGLSYSLSRAMTLLLQNGVSLAYGLSELFLSEVFEAEVPHPVGAPW